MLKKVLLLGALAMFVGCGDAPKKNSSNNQVNNGTPVNNGSTNNGSTNNGTPVNNGFPVNNGIPVNNGTVNNGLPVNNGMPVNNGVGGLCDNGSDREIIFNTDTSTPAANCALSCLNDGAFETCHPGCVSEETGLSLECSTCYTIVANCAITNCGAVCISEPTGEDCAICQTDEGCDAEYETCAGVPRR